MPRQPYSLNNYVGGASPAFIGGNITNSQTSIIASGTNTSWGTLGISGGFFLALNYGTATEEKVWVPSGSYNWNSGLVTLNGISRQVDGTTAVNHFQGDPVVPVLTATDLEEANILVAKILSSGTLTTSGMAVFSTGADITYAQPLTLWFQTGHGDPIFTNPTLPTITGSLYYDLDGTGIYYSTGPTTGDWAGFGGNWTDYGVGFINTASGVYDSYLTSQGTESHVYIQDHNSDTITLDGTNQIISIYAPSGISIFTTNPNTPDDRVIQLQSSGNFNISSLSDINIDGTLASGNITILGNSYISVSGHNIGINSTSDSSLICSGFLQITGISGMEIDTYLDQGGFYVYDHNAGGIGFTTQSGNINFTNYGTGGSIWLSTKSTIQFQGYGGGITLLSSGVITETATNNLNLTSASGWIYTKSHGGTYITDNISVPNASFANSIILSGTLIQISSNKLTSNLPVPVPNQFSNSQITVASGYVTISGAQIGFFDSPGISKPTITGHLSAVTDANALAVLGSIIAALSGYGLAINGTT